MRYMTPWVILVLLASDVSAAADPIVIRFSHVVAPKTPKGLAADWFRVQVEEDTHGRVKVEVYPQGKLFKDNEEMNALLQGKVEMLAPSLSKFSSIGVHGFELFDLPYIFPNKQTLYRVMDGEVGKRLFRQLEPKGIVGLAYWDNGFKQISANRAIAHLKDFKDLKIRIQASQILQAQIRALGAQPEVIGFSQQYKALKQGKADGAENTVSNFYSQKLYEVQKHLMLSDHGYLGYSVIVNKKFWDRLPPDIRPIVEAALKKATQYERRIAQAENDEALIRMIRNTEIHILPPNVRKEWASALFPVHKEAEDVIGKDNLRAIYAIAEQVDKEERKQKQQR